MPDPESDYHRPDRVRNSTLKEMKKWEIQALVEFLTNFIHDMKLFNQDHPAGGTLKDYSRMTWAENEREIVRGYEEKALKKETPKKPKGRNRKG